MENTEDIENKEENKDNKKEVEPKKSKSLVIILVSIIALLLLLSGFGWWYVGKKAAQEKEKALNDAKSALEKQINDLKKLKTPAPTPISTPTPTPLTSPDCVSTLTDADNLAIATWSTYTNNKNNYSFKYPESWVVSEDQDDFVSLSDAEASINFQFRSDAMSAIGYESYKIDSEQNITVACIDTEKKNLSGNTDWDPASANDRMIFALFNKDSVPHLVMITYQYVGASISSDIVEAFDLILKTIEFE